MKVGAERTKFGPPLGTKLKQQALPISSHTGDSLLLIFLLSDTKAEEGCHFSMKLESLLCDL